MAGVKKYDRDDLLDRAMDLFHRQGFNGTSTAELVDELAVNRKTMYAEFGSKQALFEAALEHYDQHSLGAVLRPTEAPGAGLDELRATFAGFASASKDWAQGRGCLLCNTAMERVTLDPGTGEYVDAYFGRLTAAFRGPLANAQSAGDLSASADIDDLAAFYVMALVGIATLAKGKADPDQIEAATNVALGVLDAHAPG